MCKIKLHHLIGICVFAISIGDATRPILAGRIQVYWSVNQDNVIRRSNLDGTEAEDVLQTPGGARPDIAFDPVEQKMYWPSPVVGGIQRANYDGSKIEMVIFGLDVPTHVAIDSVNRKAYWADIGIRNTIWRSNLDGTDRETLVENVPRITSVEVDPTNGYYYWSESLHGTIHRTSVEDNSRTAVIFDDRAFGRAGLPEGLAIDSANGFVYATDSAFQAIVRMRLDGSDPMLWVTRGVSNPHGIVIDEFNQRIIWSNEEKSPAMRNDTNISSVSFRGDDQHISFVPHALFGMVGFVRHLAIVEDPLPEPNTLVSTILSMAMLLLITRTDRNLQN